jgi:hypothetical protein
MNYWHCLNSCSLNNGEPSFQTQELGAVLVIDVELEEIMRKLPIVDRMAGVDPLTEEDELIR